MSTEYGLVTRDMAEKEILKVLNDKLKYFFTEAANKNYDIYTSYTLSKMKNLSEVQLVIKKKIKALYQFLLFIVIIFKSKDIFHGCIKDFGYIHSKF